MSATLQSDALAVALASFQTSPTPWARPKAIKDRTPKRRTSGRSRVSVSERPSGSGKPPPTRGLRHTRSRRANAAITCDIPGSAADPRGLCRRDRLNPQHPAWIPQSHPDPESTLAGNRDPDRAAGQQRNPSGDGVGDVDAVGLRDPSDQHRTTGLTAGRDHKVQDGDAAPDRRVRGDLQQGFRGGAEQDPARRQRHDRAEEQSLPGGLGRHPRRDRARGPAPGYGADGPCRRRRRIEPSGAGRSGLRPPGESALRWRPGAGAHPSDPAPDSRHGR